MSDEVHRRVKVDTPAVAILRDVASYERDFLLAVRYLDLYLDSDLESTEGAPNELDALWTTAVVYYGRAFHKDVRKSLAPLHEIYDDEQRASHDYFFDLRNKFLAHSVNGYEQTTVSVGLTDPATPAIVEVRVALDSVSRMAGQHAETLRNLCRLQLAMLKAKGDDLRRQVAEEAQKLGADYLYALPALPDGARPDIGPVGRRRK